MTAITIPPDPKGTLDDLLRRPRLDGQQALTGIVACFALTSQGFLARRMPQADEAQRRAAALELVTQVSRELGVLSRRQPGVAELQRVCRVLEEQLGFTAEPDLLAKHRGVIQNLLARVRG